MRWRDYDYAEVVSDWDRRKSGTRTYITNPTYYVETSDGDQFKQDGRDTAIALATLLERINDVEVIRQRTDVVPISVAVEGKPAIATYLRGVHEMSIEEIADQMKIKRRTVKKYLNRFRPYTDS